LTYEQRAARFLDKILQTLSLGSKAEIGATMRTELLRFNAVERDPAIDWWMKEHAGDQREHISKPVSAG
jgi:hypothetical protein